MGSPRFHTVEVDGLRLIDAWFPPDLTLQPHFHERTCFAVLLGGSMAWRLGQRRYECSDDTVWTEPAGELHGNRFHADGAHVLVLQPDPECAELLDPCQDLLGKPSTFEHAGIAGLARAIIRELNLEDSLSPLAIEAFALEMLVTAARGGNRQRQTTEKPEWLGRVEELVRERFREPIRIAELAREVGVHPVHLARVFKRHKNAPLAYYMRVLRLDWAANRLLTTEAPISTIAFEAGFADQSHFTRAFKRHTGLTPGRYRSAAGQ
jgi:AraC family transcriptional regulator